MSGGQLHVGLAALVATLALHSFVAAQDPPADAKTTEPAPADPTAAEVFREAYAISTQSGTRTTADYAEMVELCVHGLALDPNDRERAYGLQLATWAFERWGKALAGGPRDANALAAAEELIEQGQILMSQKLADDKHRMVAQFVSQAMTSRGEARLDAEELETAKSDFATAADLDETNYMARQNLGLVQALEGEYDAAMKNFSQVLRINPRYANAWFNRGEIEYQRGQWREAIQSYSNALQLVPNDAVTLVARGHAHYRSRDYRSAINDFSAALRANPQHVEALTHRGIAYSDVGYFEQAANDFRAALRADPDYGPAWQGAGWLMATCPIAAYRIPADALRAAEKAIELDGTDHYRYVDTLAAALAVSGRYEEAAAKQAEALEMAADESDLVKDELKQRLALYEEGKPFTEKAPTR